MMIQGVQRLMLENKCVKTLCQFFLTVPFLLSCAQVNVPGARNLNIPSPTLAEEKPEGINERPDSVLYLPLGSDVLLPEATTGQSLPSEMVGPFELRSETLAGALQLILADYDLPLAFETDEALTRTITVANLKGPLNTIVQKICGLADLYCSYEEGILVVKETQTFMVTVPPVGLESGLINSLATGLQAITGSAPIVDAGTRTIIYEATSRTSELARRYFQKLRANTALIVFEIYIWEVELNMDNRSGIDWTNVAKIGGASISIPGGFPGGGSPVSIGIPSLNDGVTFSTNKFFQFLSEYGAVKTISQPQITILSGSEASITSARTTNYVSSLTRTIDNNQTAVSTTTDSVDTGFNLTISSAWDNATVYGSVAIDLNEFLGFQTFIVEASDANGGGGQSLQLPETTVRSLNSQIRMRPGDTLVLAGIIRETDQFTSSGPGFEEPIIPTSRNSDISNSEVVFMMKPRVVVFTDDVNLLQEQQRKNKKTTRGKREEYREENIDLPEQSLDIKMLDPSL